MSGEYHKAKGVNTDELTIPVPLPSIADFVYVVFRNVEAVDEEGNVDQDRTNYLTFVHEWYVREYLPKVALDFAWKEKYHGDGPVSYQTIGEKSKDERVTPSTEAFAVAVYESCHAKWTNAHHWKNDPENKGKRIPRYQKSQEETHQFKTLYSDSEGGVQRWGGWSTEGKSRFYQLCKLIHNNRIDNEGNVRNVDMQVVDKIAQEVNAQEAEDGKKPAKKAKMVEEDIENDDYDEF